MAERVMVLIGTKKGLFITESDAERRVWQLKGPFCEHWPINHAVADPATGTIYAAGGSEWFGPAVWRSTDFGQSWSRSSAGLAYKEGEAPVKTAWSVSAVGGRLLAGVEPAGLFESFDGGDTWTEVSGLRDHPSRAEWQAGGAGLILHSIVVDPVDPKSVFVGISAAGVFHTSDGGTRWETRNSGTRCDFLPEDQRYPEFGQCVHCLVLAPGGRKRLYQQNHCGMYRSDDYSAQWQSIESGLPSSFGFPAATHPTDPDTLFLAPLNGDSAGRYMTNASAAIWRTRDAGASWQALRAGLPQQNFYSTVLRQAMATDRLEPAGVYFGTSAGALYGSPDEGENWTCIAPHLPAISSVETLTVPA